MRILVISSSAPLGKGESFVISEVNSIASAGNEVILVPTILRRGSPNRFRLDSNVWVVSQPSLSFTVLFSLIHFAVINIRIFVGLCRLVKNTGVKNRLKNYMVIPKAIWLARELKKNPIDHIHAHWLTTPSTLAMLVSELTGVEWSVTAHRGDIVANNILPAKFSSASFVRFISKSGKQLAKARAALREQKAYILPMGVNVVKATSRCSKRSLREKKVIILCPANLIPVKGHDFLFHSISVMRNRSLVKLLIAGDGELRAELERTVEVLGLEAQVFFEGHIPHSELMKRYRLGKIDVVVLPSRDLGGGLHEGIPVSLMEAMAWRVPVISTRTGGIPELLENEAGEKFGVLVNADDVEALANALDELVLSENKRHSLGEVGCQRVLADFNQEKIAAQLVDLMRASPQKR